MAHASPCNQSVSTHFRHVAPAGSPIAPGDIVRAMIAAAKRSDGRSLAEHVAERFGVRHAVTTSTGRAGMTLLLRAMRRIRPDRTEVVLPSYTCYSVAACTMKAGLRPRLVDIHPATLDFVPARLERLDLSRTLAVVATNLYGLANDLPRLRTLARAQGAFLIDDAAQSMGATAAGEWSGTLGDAGLFSFDKGKPASAIDGGAVVTNSDEIGDAVRREVGSLASRPLVASMVPITKAVLYAGLLRPRLYWIPNGIPFLGLGRTEYSTEFPVGGPDRFLAELGVLALGRLDQYVEIRRRNATALISALRPLEQIHAIQPLPGTAPSYLRLPVLMEDRGIRDRALASLHQAGIGATASYPRSLADVPELAETMRNQAGEAAGGRLVADRILTLPTHPYVTAADIRTIADVCSAELESRVGSRAAQTEPQPSLCAE